MNWRKQLKLREFTPYETFYFINLANKNHLGYEDYFLNFEHISSKLKIEYCAQLYNQIS